MRDMALFAKLFCKNIEKQDTSTARFNKFFTAIMALSNRLGHYWHYTSQHPDVDWMDTEFPFGMCEPARWTVTEWEAAQDTGGDQALVPVAWTPLAKPNVWPGIEEDTFCQRLIASEEHQDSEMQRRRAKADQKRVVKAP